MPLVGVGIVAMKTRPAGIRSRRRSSPHQAVLMGLANPGVATTILR
jgi:hypothetical protein